MIVRSHMIELKYSIVQQLNRVVFKSCVGSSSSYQNRSTLTREDHRGVQIVSNIPPPCSLLISFLVNLVIDRLRRGLTVRSPRSESSSNFKIISLQAAGAATGQRCPPSQTSLANLHIWSQGINCTVALTADLNIKVTTCKAHFGSLNRTRYLFSSILSIYLQSHVTILFDMYRESGIVFNFLLISFLFKDTVTRIIAI